MKKKGFWYLYTFFKDFKLINKPVNNKKAEKISIIPISPYQILYSKRILFWEKISIKKKR